MLFRRRVPLPVPPLRTTSEQIHELNRRLDHYGFTLVTMEDPVDGFPIVGLDWAQVTELLNKLEGLEHVGD